MNGTFLANFARKVPFIAFLTLPVVLQHLGHQRGDRGTLGARQRDVREEGMPLQLFNDGRHAVMPPDAQVVTLRDVVGEHYPRCRAQPREHGEQDVAFQ